MHDARESSHKWLVTMPAATLILRINSNPVRRRCSDSQPTSIQSQVGCNRISHAMATRGTAEHDNIDLHTTQTEAITALRVSTTARRTMPRASSRNWLETMQAPVSTRNDYSNPVRRRCSDSQPTSTQSQVGCNPYSAVQMRHARLRVRRHQSAHEPD